MWWGGWSFGLWLVALERGSEEVKAQSPATAGWGAVGCGGVAGVLGFGSCGLESALEEVKAQSPATAGQPVTKTPKIPKIPIVVDVLGS